MIKKIRRKILTTIRITYNIEIRSIEPYKSEALVLFTVVFKRVLLYVGGKTYRNERDVVRKLNRSTSANLTVPKSCASRLS